jgi:uncharacterized protein YdaU (DUF1376 family)
MKVFSYPRKINDWRRKTAMMSLEERGVYSELIDWYYCTGAEMPSDFHALCRMIGATRRSEKDALRRVLSSPNLFLINGSRLVQTMCDETLSFIEEKSKSASRSAEHRWNKNKVLRDANVLRSNSECTANHKPETINQSSPNGEDVERTPKPDGGSRAKPRRQRQQKPTTFISEDFGPDFRNIARATELGLSLEDERSRFIDHFLAKGEARADWQASFRTWLGNSAKYRAEREQRKPSGRQEAQGVVGAALRVAARYSGQG